MTGIGPCARCGNLLPLRDDDLCRVCAAGVDEALAAVDAETEHQKSAQAFETFLGLGAR